MNTEIKITPPEGYEVDEENSTFECIKFKPIKPQLPATWEEFCKTHSIKPGECSVYSGGYSNILKFNYKTTRVPSLSKNVLPSLEYAQAILALCQLIQLRDCYNDGWQPDWSNDDWKYCLSTVENKITNEKVQLPSRVLTFKTRELMEKFFENFKDLIEIAKPLL